MNRIAVLSALAISLGAMGQTPAKPAPGPAPGVNWVGQVVKATGSGAPDVKAATPAQARLGAEKAAQMDAFRNLLAQVKGIQVSAGKTVGEAMTTDEIKGKVDGVIRGYKVTGKRYFSDGGVEVDVEVPLSALTEIFAPAGDTAIASVKTDGDKKNTGLVIDARGLDVKPALSPKVFDEAGKELYGVSALSVEARKVSGVAAYVKTLEEAKKCLKVGDKPLVLKASKAKGSDLVLAAEDVKKLAEANNSYLAEGRVVIVTN
ncbi:MAG: LPP20 family lipoprotein [Myxococcaceae bacterium]